MARQPAADATQQAAAISTLRVLARMLRPEFVFISTHDSMIAETIRNELAPIDDWPSEFALLRFSRKVDGTTAVDSATSEASEGNYARDLEDLGLGGMLEVG